MSENSTGNIAIDGAIDAGWTSYYDADKHGTKTMSETESTGETVSGTSPDDFGEITTDNWPSHIDPSDVGTDLRKHVIEIAAMHQGKSQRQLADIAGCSSGLVSNTLREHWPDHPTVGGYSRPSATDVPSSDEATLEDAAEVGPLVSDGDDLARVKTAAEAIHATATHQETRDAVMHLLDLCPDETTVHE